MKYYIIGGCALLLLIIILIVILKHKKKQPKLNIDQNYIKELIEKFGGKENIKSIEVEKNKLKVEVIDRKILDLDGLKEMASTGVFLTVNTVKTLFKYDSEVLKKELSKYKGV